MTRKNIILMVVSSSIFFEALDIAIVNLAMPLVQADFHLAGDQVQWMQTLYVLFYGGFLIAGGKLADIMGRKKIFLLGSALFLLTSLGAGLSTSFQMLSFFRAVQGLGAAFVMPAALSIVTNTFTEKNERNRAIGIFGSFAAIGSGSGLSLGGLIATYLGWQWVFFINVPVIGLALILAQIYVPDDGKVGRRKIDILSGAVLTIGILLMTYIIHDLPHFKEQMLVMIIMLVAAGLCAYLFVQRAKRSDPLIDFAILNKRMTLAGNSTMVLMGAFFTSYLFLISIVFQNYREFSAAEAGLMLLPFSVLSAIVSKSILPRALKRISINEGAVVGMALMSLGGAILWIGAWLGFPLISILLSVACVTGTGIAVCFTTLTVISVQEVPHQHHGLAASFTNTCFFLGGGLGLSIISLCMQLTRAFESPILPIGIMSLYAIIGTGWVFANRNRVAAIETQNA